MKVVGVRRFGGPEVLEVFDAPEPHAGPGEVRIRVHAATVNPGDRDMRIGAVALAAPAPPYIPGMEAAGVLDEIGPGTATRLRTGEHVMAMVMPNRREGGAYAEYVVLPADWVAAAPAGASHAQAATLPMNGLTARQALDLLDLAPGQILAVTGGAGAVGGNVVQLAKADGLEVVADCAPQDADLLRSLGADLLVVRGDNVADRFLEAVPGGVDGLLDGAVIGTSRLVRAVRDGGGIVAVRGEVPDRARVVEMSRRRITPHMVNVPNSLGDQRRMAALRHAAESGALTLRVAKTLPAEQAPEAHRMMEAGGTRGRIVLTF
ncbi:NADP-dependent oxidoreductase [Streptomyces sp. NBC_00872]|uniref:NADP-dependent oxidoreductase n=1 Tax=Streptomyces sp. NBC_00872 TaxID=2903686 RepID=UPI0038637A9B|nr:NADP-dependent oxidoreductase [Streptomyces sp. NBC_00872]